MIFDRMVENAAISLTASSGKSDGVKPSEESIGGKTPLIGGKTPLGIDSSSRVKPVSKLMLKQPDGHHVIGGAYIPVRYR